MASFSLRRIFVSQLMGWVLISGIGIYFLLPLRQHIRLGMDLAGGTYLTLEVQTDKAVEAELVEQMQGIETKLKEAHQPSPITKKITKSQIELSFDSIQVAQQVSILLKDHFKDLEQKQEGTTIYFSFSQRKEDHIKEEAVTRNIGVLRMRLDPYGAADVSIARQGDKNIIIELPDAAKTLEAKARIGKSAQLDFRVVEKMASNPDDILIDFDGDLPADKEIVAGKSRGDQAPEYYLVSKYANLTGKFIKDARASLGGDTGVEPAVSFTLTSEGARRFYDLTGKNIGRYIAIILDGVVISVGRIKSAIRDSGQISGGFKDTKETRELAVLLQSGAYVAPVTFEEERQIGPSLGRESIKSGLLSCLVSMCTLFVFSIIFYKLAGVLAFMALLLNLLFILFGLSLFKATLTLPGIAGMVLTVGMAIDASILIFEHIREALKSAIPVRQAVKDGFSGAMMIILDANITTFVVGVVLYYTGTGPIQGFAVTMMIGIISTLITGLFFLRSLFTFMFDNFSIQRLRI